ncbi:MAG: glycosyltransferase family 4 protein [Chthoniobacterales bacterium]
MDTAMTLGGIGGWNAILRRNEWFQTWVSHEVARSDAHTVFSYSYTARLPFAAARRRGARRILGQIDPGPREEEIVREASSKYLHLAPPDEMAPRLYWERWKEEVELAEKIVVNSPWSAKLLVEAGVSAAKLVEIPLVYERADSTCDEWLVTSDESNRKRLKRGNTEPEASKPEVAPRQRLRALFLGSVILRKGVGQLFDAIQMLKSEPVDFTFAGPVGVRIPDEISQLPNVRFLGPVDKATCETLYESSDVFLFPTLSDGFGLTQLEALGHGLPIIASTNCGRVVEDRVNGLALDEVTPETIAGAIMELVRDRDILAALKANARIPDQCLPKYLAPALLALGKN